jgi:hypothetical protein
MKRALYVTLTCYVTPVLCSTFVGPCKRYLALCNEQSIILASTLVMSFTFDSSYMHESACFHFQLLHTTAAAFSLAVILLHTTAALPLSQPNISLHQPLRANASGQPRQCVLDTCTLLCCSMVASLAWTMWGFYGLNYAFAYACFCDTPMGHYTWYLVPVTNSLIQQEDGLAKLALLSTKLKCV